MEGFQTADSLASESKDLGEDEGDPARFLQGHLPMPDGHDRRTIFNQAVDKECGRAHGRSILDLTVERFLAFERPVPVQDPDNIVGEARQDRTMVRTPKSVNVGFDDLRLRRHCWLSPGVYH